MHIRRIYKKVKRTIELTRAHLSKSILMQNLLRKRWTYLRDYRKFNSSNVNTKLEKDLFDYRLDIVNMDKINSAQGLLQAVQCHITEDMLQRTTKIDDTYSAYTINHQALYFQFLINQGKASF